MFVKLCVATAVMCVVCRCETVDGDKYIVGDESLREAKEFEPEGWRGVSEQKLDMSGWIPHDQGNPLLIRRRIRKRKRRPPTLSLTDVSDENLPKDRLLKPRRRLRPQILEDTSSTWDDMERESMKTPMIRRKIIPVYKSEEEFEETQIQSRPKVVVNQLINIKPLAASIQFGEPEVEYPKADTEDKSKGDLITMELLKKNVRPSTTTTTTNPPDLKTLLKQTGGSLSLSEILQQKNMSLAELLNGNQKAISALTEKPESTEAPLDFLEHQTKYKRLPPSIGLKKGIDRNFEQTDSSGEILTSKETIEAQRKRLALLHSHAHRDNKIYADVTKLDAVTEPITEKRIFVPSHPKHYTTTINFKTNFFTSEGKTTEKEETSTKFLEESTDPIVTTTFEDKSVELSNTVIPLRTTMRNLPMTTAKLLRTSKTLHTKPTVQTIPPKAFKINLEEIFEAQSSQKHKVKSDEPTKITLNLEVPSSTIENNEDNQKETTTNGEIIQATSEESINEKIKVVTAKEEINEILKDPVNRERLSRILETRNMTLEELVEQRERGSSQVHLADIFHNKTREPEPIEEVHVGHIISPDHFNTFLNRQQKSRTFPPSTTMEVPEIKPSEIPTSKKEDRTVVTEKAVEQTTSKPFPTYQFDYNKNLNVNIPPETLLPFWKEFYPSLFPQVYENKPPETKNNVIHYNDIQRIEEIENKLSEIANEKLNIEATQNYNNLNEDSFISFPSGVKSAIIASFAIIGLSLFVFLTILLIFKWSQKRRKKLNYTGSFSGSKIKSPILEIPQRRTLKSFMCETLGRKKTYYKSYLQNTADSIWDTKKPF